MANINKTELIKAIMEGSDMKNYYTAQVIINAFIEQIKLQVEAGNVVSIKGLGTFYFAQKKTLPMPPPSRQFKGKYYWWLTKQMIGGNSAEFKQLNLSNLKNFHIVKDKIKQGNIHVSRNGIRWDGTALNVHYPEYLEDEGSEDGIFVATYYKRVGVQFMQLSHKPRLKCRMSATMNVPEGMRPKFKAIYKYRGNVGKNLYSRSLQGCDLMTNTEYQAYMNDVMPS